MHTPFYSHNKLKMQQITRANARRQFIYQQNLIAHAYHFLIAQAFLRAKIVPYQKNRAKFPILRIHVTLFTIQ